ncbi:MAG: Gfo/Idh/MocA family oxidoreductase [Chloroflexi bacterium]|nr:Gfo/Idh/MocA family oxidoreductase [Chloroflexota bacterium]
MSAARSVTRVGVIGCGYWGPNLIRNFARHDGARVVAVCDAQLERAEKMASWYGVPLVTNNATELIESGSVDLVVVATPSRTHYSLAKQAILAGKHVLVMKPMTTQVDQAEELVDLATRNGVMLAVDHTFVYAAAVRKMRDLVVSGELGDVFYVDSVRINLGVFQSDVNVIWDLAVHDVSIVDYVLGGVSPTEVTAVAAAHAGSWAANIAYLTMRYAPDVLAHIHVNWLAPAKIRRTIIGGSRRMVVYDDMHPSEKLLVYDRGVSIAPWSDPEDVYGALVSYRSGDMSAPNLDAREALAVEVDHLLECLATGTPPIADGLAGLRAVKVLEAANLASGTRLSPRANWEGAVDRPALEPIPIDGLAG